MHHNTKKILAKEVFLFLLCIAITVTTFIAVNIYNSFLEYEITNLNKEYTSKRILADSLNRVKYEKVLHQFLLTNQLYAEESDVDSTAHRNMRLWKRLYILAKNDSIRYRWVSKSASLTTERFKKIGFLSPDSLKNYILRNIINSKDQEAYKTALKYYGDLGIMQSIIARKQSSILNWDDKIKATELAFIISICVLFLLRYLFYGFRWSVKILQMP